MIQTETLELLEWPRLCQHLATFAATKLGAIAARQLVIPDAPAQTQALLNQTREVYELESQLTASLKFAGIQDIGPSLERTERQGILSGQELLDIATTLAAARQLRRTIDAQEEEEFPTLQAIVSELRTFPELEQEIRHCIDDRAQVTDRANPKLRGIREQLRTTRDRIQRTLQRIMQRHSGAMQEAVITQRGDRFVLPVKASQKDAVPGIVHDASTSGVTLYVEPQSVVPLGNQLRQLVRQEEVAEEKVRRVLTEQVAEVLPELEELLAIVTVLDLATARARYSLWLGANPPRLIQRPDVKQETAIAPGEPPSDELNEPEAAVPDALSAQNQGPDTKPDDALLGERVVLRQLRHPLLVWQAQHEEGPEVVPIDVTINPKIRVVAITGPNTGGKTVTLKTIGLAALMAKVGLFVPAREPVELPWFDQVLADIGDEQSIEQSLSTFSGHIRRIGRVLDALASRQPEVANALVLLDEVGAGTDPSEGSALAIALLKHLANRANLTVATTHFGELKALKYQDERFENASVEFNDQTLSPTYRLLWGIPGRSNALTIARRLGLEGAVVDQARELVGMTGVEDVNEVIAGLEAQRREQEARSQEANALLLRAETLHKELARKAQSLRDREQALKQEQEQAVQQAIAQAKGEIAGVIRRLQKGEPTGQQAQAATEKINAIAERKLPSKAPKPKPGFKPQVGDRVRIPRLGQTAEVTSAANDDGEVGVRFGLMKMTVSLADVESLQGEKAELPERRKSTPAPPPPPKADAPAVRTSKNTIDIRGNRVADAEITLDRYIAAATGPIWIIHGHGTGKLRAGVHEFLKRHPQVARFEAAERADGGTGVTVAYMQ
ncbi:MAG: endonuclease MutS2 [Cyanobacteria bacterium P01_A01_bin.135]